MDDSFPVSRSQPAGHLLHDVNRFTDLKLAPLLQKLMEVLTLQILHGDELDLSRFADIENADDVPVRHLTCKDQLLLEALQYLGMLRQLRLDHLERDITLKLCVSGLVYGAHSAFTEQFQQFISPAKQISNLQLTRAALCIGKPAGRHGIQNCRLGIDRRCVGITLNRRVENRDICVHKL